MPRAPRRLVAALLVYLFALTPTRSARAQFVIGHIGPTGGQVAGAFIGAGAIIGVGLYFLFRHPRVTGCATSGPTGLELRRDSTPPETYLLTGATTSIPSGSRIKVSGKRHKDAIGHPTFQVESLKKVYGPCAALPATP